MISVVIPAFDGEIHLAATLDSVIAQTEERWECVIVDDGSTDGTAEVARKYTKMDERIRLVTQRNAGPSAARNNGFRHCSPSSEYVTFMDSDDVWTPDALKSLRNAIETSPDSVVGAHGLGSFTDGDGRPILPGAHEAFGRRRLGLRAGSLRVLGMDEPTDFSVLINGNVLFPPGLVLARREAYERAGPFDESFRAAEDWDMLIRLSRLGDLRFLDEVLLFYRRHAGNSGAGPDVAHQAWLVRCKAFYSTENSPEQRELAVRGWRAYQRLMIAERMTAARGGLRDRSVATVVPNLARVAAHGLRWVLGYPLPRFRSEPVHW